MLTINSLNFCYKKVNFFEWYFHWVYNSELTYFILFCFVFINLKVSFCYLLACMVSNKKSAAVLFPDFLWITISIWLPSRCYLFLVFWQFAMQYVGVDVILLLIKFYDLYLFCLVFSWVFVSLVWCLSLILGKNTM